MNHHLIIEAGNSWETKAGRRFVGLCDTCHSPDEDGDGAVEFFGGTMQEIVEQYEDHIRKAA